jgi:hypothetical protein
VLLTAEARGHVSSSLFSSDVLSQIVPLNWAVSLAEASTKRAHHSARPVCGRGVFAAYQEAQPRWGNVGRSLGYLPYSGFTNILTMLLVLQRSQVLGDALIYWLILVAKPVGS